MELAAPGPHDAAPSEAPPSFLSGISRYVGLSVREIRLDGLGDADTQRRLRDLIVQQANEPLDRMKIRRSLQALYATGRFSELQVEADRGPANDVTLVFVARQNYFIGSVTVDGVPRRPASHQLVGATKLQLGELYTREKVEAALRAMSSVMTDNGYYKSEIADEEQFHPDTQLVDVSFHVRPDGHARVGQVTVNGNPGYTPSQVQKIAKFRPGSGVTAQGTTRALQRLRKKYQRDGRLEAQVAITDRNYRADENTLDYVFQLDQGPTVSIRVEGAHVSRARLKKLVPVFEEGSVDDDLLNEGLRNLRDYFQTQGFFDVRVNWDREFDVDKNHRNVVYRVNLGVKHKLEAVRIEGNKSFSTDLIRERMQVKPVSNLLTHGSYSESMLSHDVDVIEETLYRANGFSHVKIERTVLDDYEGTEGRMVVILRIEEGTQVRVGALSITGNRTFDLASLESRLADSGSGLVTIAGQPFSDANLSQDRDVLMGFYFNNGFPDVQVETAYTPQKDNPNLMDVVFAIHEGEQVLVDRILISGLNYTRPYVVQRDLQVHPNTPLNQLAMLDTQRALYDLGLFNEVGMAVQNPDGKSHYKNVLFRLREAKRWTFNYGLGIEVQTGGQPTDVVNSAPAPGAPTPKGTIPNNGGIPLGTNPEGGTTFSPSVNFEVTRINFRGTDDTITFKTHLGNLQQRALVSYGAPHWFDRNDLRLTFTGLYDKSRDVRTFTSERLEGAAQLQQVIGRRGEPTTTLLYRYSYRRVKVDAQTLAISPPLIPLLSKPVLLGMPGFTYLRDKRDSVLDTHKGQYITFDLSVSAKAFGSGSVKGTAEKLSTGANSGGESFEATAANFTRVVAQNSTYQPIWRDRHSPDRMIVFARTTRIGLENVLGAGASILAIPLPERFFAGGATSHRGFGLNQAGPRDLTTGFPLGGNASFLNSVELRLAPPVLPYVGTNLSFVLFHDAGNVFQSGTEMLHSFSRWQQQNRLACRTPAQGKYVLAPSDITPVNPECRFDYMSQAFGTGVRYKTPIGPVRLDFSYNLSPPSFPYYVQCPASPSPGEVAPCNSLPGNTRFFQTGTLRHFNFFFSIGQSF
jgi:outer membrane protein insertion porin family